MGTLILKYNFNFKVEFFRSGHLDECVTIQIKATEEYFHAVYSVFINDRTNELDDTIILPIHLICNKIQ